MRLPRQDRNFQVHVGYGRYVAARLRQVRREEQAAEVDAAGSLVKERGRAWEDAFEALSSQAAQRDAVDDALDTAAQEFRLKLAARSVGADRRPPYTAIFPKGIAYYTASPLSENEKRYRELLARAEAQLEASDADLVALRTTVPALIDAFGPAEAALDKARTRVGLARTALEAAVDAWLTQLERTYGTLVAELGRRKAERFFPKTPAPATVDEEEPAPAAAAT
jgi:hypothetical protein